MKRILKKFKKKYKITQTEGSVKNKIFQFVGKH
jgi:hypothetical protein